MVFCNLIAQQLYYFLQLCHNPYFNRWFSAMPVEVLNMDKKEFVTILILIDGFLQSGLTYSIETDPIESQSLF